MLKVFLYKRIEGLPDSILVNLFLTKDKEFGQLFQKVSSEPFKKMVDFVSTPKEADYILLPHTYHVLEKKFNDYLVEAEQYAVSLGVKILIFAYGDIHTDVCINNSIILRTAKYKNNISDNEVIVPPFIEDLGKKYGVEHIDKSALPIVGFAGMTNLPTLWGEVKYRIKIILKRLSEFLARSNVYERQGLYFRRKIIHILSSVRSCGVSCHKRKSYSAARTTIQDSPEIIRREFVEVIKGSHLPLVIRGNGNYSLRFFEVLSLGRVPLFIDTETPLPMEDKIDYDSFMLRVDYKDIDKLEEIISKFWASTPNEKFLDMQKKARYHFETFLKADVFYKKIFESLESVSDKRV